MNELNEHVELATPTSAPMTPSNVRMQSRKIHCTSTQAAYARDVERFVRIYGGSIPCSADTLLTFIYASAKRVAPATLYRRCMAIRDAHARAGVPLPTDDPRVREVVRRLCKGIRPVPGLQINAEEPTRLPRVVKSKSAKPISRALLLRMIDAMSSGTRSLDRRDLLILTLGFAGLKRAEICALNIEDVRFTEDAMVLRVKKPAPQAGLSELYANRVISMLRGPLCAATACKTWIEHHQLAGQAGPLIVRFTRSGEPTTRRLDAGYINQMIKSRLRAAGVDNVEGYSAESLRERNGRCCGQP